MAKAPLNASTTTVEDGGRHDDALARALSALQGERTADAERIAAEALQTKPHSAEAMYILGCAMIRQGRAGEAIAPLEAAVRKSRNAEFDTALAIALRQAGRHEDAVSRLRLATRRRRPSPAAFEELGHLLILMDRYDEAAEILGRGLAIAPKRSQLAMQLGYAHLTRRDCVSAKLAFARALEISPGSPDALFGIAKAHQELGESEIAAGHFRSYLTARPNDAGAWLSLGHCLLESGELSAGYECFRVAARGEAKRYDAALTSLVAAARGRFWLRPSEAARFLRASSPPV